jgi:hypothetical protein
MENVSAVTVINGLALKTMQPAKEETGIEEKISDPGASRFEHDILSLAKTLAGGEESPKHGLGRMHSKGSRLVARPSPSSSLSPFHSHITCISSLHPNTQGQIHESLLIHDFYAQRCLDQQTHTPIVSSHPQILTMWTLEKPQSVASIASNGQATSAVLIARSST